MRASFAGVWMAMALTAACGAPADATKGAPDAGPTSANDGATPTSPDAGTSRGDGGTPTGCGAAAVPSSCAPAKVVLNPAATYKSIAEASAFAVGDVTGDGKADLVLAYGSTISVALNNGDGTFGAPVTVRESITGADIAVADFNGDCKADLLVASFNSSGAHTMDLLLSNGDGTFKAPISVDSPDTNPLSIAVADLDMNGRPDFVVFNNSGTSGAGFDVYLATANGFSPPTNYGGALDANYYPFEPRGLTAADVDGDGAPELLVAATGHGACVLKNDGHGGFNTPPVCYAATQGYNGDTIAVGDINGDEKPDLALGTGQTVTNGMSLIDVYLNNGDGTFGSAAAVAFPGPFYGPVSLIDVNNDKKRDLVVYYGAGPAGFWVYLNDGKGAFPSTPSSIHATPAGNAQPGYGDFLGNGLVGMASLSNSGDVKDDVAVVTASCGR